MLEDVLKPRFCRDFRDCYSARPHQLPVSQVDDLCISAAFRREPVS
jgi:hypothetical protein